MKRKQGSGTIETRPGGMFRFRVTLADGTRRSSSHFRTREECEQVLVATLSELSAGHYAPIGAGGGSAAFGHAASISAAAPKSVLDRRKQCW